MVSASFRFHAELNDFLAPARRHRVFECACARAATTKHMVEALGVPHTEVALLTVNGEPAGFDRLLREGDRVVAYPAAASTGDGRRDDVPLHAHFIADSHLGGLAHLLRMAGFDTLYDNHYADPDIEALAVAEQRIVLTRDRELLKRRGIARGCYVHARQSVRQLHEVFGRFGLQRRIQPFTRCLKCNSPLHPVAKAAVAERLPPGVRQRHERFSACDTCQQVFWEGSHWHSMRQLLAELTTELAADLS